MIVTVSEFVSIANSHCNPADPQFESLAEAQVKDQVRGLLQRWLESEDSNIDHKSAAIAASWAIYGLVLQWSHEKSKKRLSAEKFAEQILPLIALSLSMKQPA